MDNDHVEPSQDRSSQEQAQETAPEPFSKEERTWALVCHLSALSGYVGIPFGHIIGPLVIWLIKKEEMPLVDDQGKEALNFHISVTIYGIVSALLIFVIIGWFLVGALVIFSIVMTIVAAIKAYDGEYYRYPLTIRLIK